MGIATCARMLLPAEGVDLGKWAVVACDQFTSQPEYWQSVEDIVGDAPSALRLVLPEAFLTSPDARERALRIGDTMRSYIAGGVLEEREPGMMLVQREMASGKSRRGIVLAVDLEAYDYSEGSSSLIRPTERTIEERIPARLAVRRGAPLELPHTMILVDDPDRSIVQAAFERVGELELAYECDLMMGGGRVKGWFAPRGPVTDGIEAAVDALGDAAAFRARYGYASDSGYDPLACVVGDGNHSMAAAKACWEETKAGLSEGEAACHPARWALAEIVSVHDDGIEFEGIHRLLSGVDPDGVLDAAVGFFERRGAHAALDGEDEGFGAARGLGEAERFGAAQGRGAAKGRDSDRPHVFPWAADGRTGRLIVEGSPWALPAASLQAFLDEYLSGHAEAGVDYIHGAETLRMLASEPGRIGFALPDLPKDDLFRGVIEDGALPRKTFSIGEARDKRYYMEAKRIV